MTLYTRTFHVRHYELDSLGYVNNAVYLNYLQQAAIEASASAGYSMARYDEMGAMWLVRKTIIEYGRPAVFNDELEVKTWVSDFKRVQSNREYIITHIPSGEIVARARSAWAYVDKTRMRVKRIPPEMYAAFQPNGQCAVRHLEPGHGEKETAAPRQYITRRRAQYYELDAAQHINNAVYLNWVEQAFFDACAAAGYPAHSFTAQTGVVIVACWNEIEYFRPAVAGDEIEIKSWVSSITRTHSTWTYEMRRVSDDALLIRAYATGAFLTPAGRPTRLPADYQAAIIGTVY